MSMAEEFQLDQSTPGTLALSGALNFDTAAAVLQAIQSVLTSVTPVRLDLAGVSLSDSAGLACVLAVVAAADRRGQSVQVVHVPASMQVLAQVCEVNDLLT